MAAISTWPGWRTVRKIGAGSFGTVYEIETTENGVIRKAALKVMSVPASPEDLQDIYDSGIASTEEDATTYINSQITNLSQECRVMAALRGNPNIVTFEDHIVIPHKGWIGADILIRMELLTPLNRYLREHVLREEDIIRVGIDMCNALETCHAKVPPILHRDIKAANIMVDDAGHFKLGDFGVARVMEGTKSAHTKAGTEDHMAPEVLQMQGYRATADLYSLGIVLYRLLNNNRNPFLPVEGSLTENMQMQARALRLSGQPVPPPRYGSPALQAVIMKAASYLPQDRYQTAGEMRAALQQCLPYMQGAPYGGESSTVNMRQTSGPAQGYSQNSQGYAQSHPQGRQDPGTVVISENAVPYGGTQNTYGGQTATDAYGSIQNNYANQPDANGYNAGQGMQGTVVQGGANAAAPPEAKKKKPLIPILLGAAVILLVIAAVALMSGGGSSSSSSSSSYTPSSQSSGSSDSQSSSAENEENEFDSIEILTDSFWILPGDTMRLRLRAGSWLLDGNSQGITWSSSNEEVAAFTSAGMLEAYTPGTFTITAEFKGVTTTGEMTVVSVDEDYGAEVTIEPSKIDVKYGGDAEALVTFSGTLPENMSALAYDSAGMHLAIEWGSLENNEVTLKIDDAYSEETDGKITVLVYDKDDPSHCVAAGAIYVHFEE